MKFIPSLCTLAVLFNLGEPILAACTKPRVRREIRDLSQSEFDAYTKAHRKLYSDPGGNGLSILENFSKLHNMSDEYIHRHPSFLIWHREFLFQVETKLKEIDPSVDLPYWDWTIDAKDPNSSPVLTKYMMGANGDVNNDQCLSNGPFGGLLLKYGTDGEHCLRRDFGREIPPFPPTEVFLTLLNEKRFSFFSFLLEIYHGAPHDGIGGDVGDFSTMYSPSDPLFFLHHGFMDMIHSKWQDKNVDSPSYDGDKYGRKVTLEDKLHSFDVKVKDVLNTRSDRYCYEYPSYPRVIASPSYIPDEAEAKQLNVTESNQTSLNQTDNSVNNTNYNSTPYSLDSALLESLIELPKKAQSIMKSLEDEVSSELKTDISTNPFLSSSEFDGKGFKELTILINKKHKRGKKRNSIHRPSKLSKRWSSKNRFSVQEINEAYNLTNAVLEAIETIPDFVPICDIQKKSRRLTHKGRRVRKARGGKDKGGKDRGGKDKGGKDRGGRDKGGKDKGGKDKGGKDKGGKDKGGNKNNKSSKRH